MSAAMRELRGYEEAARQRLSGSTRRMGEDVRALAGSSARHHPWAHVATGGLVGFLVAAGAKRKRPERGRRPRRVLRGTYRLVRLWALRQIVSD